MGLQRVGGTPLNLPLSRLSVLPFFCGFSIFQIRSIALSCSSLLDSGSSSSDESGCDSPPARPLLKVEKEYVFSFPVGSVRDDRSVGGSVRSKYSFTRQWYGKEEMLNRVASILRSRNWQIGFPDGLTVVLDESNVSLILHELFFGSSDAALAFFFFRWSQRHNGTKHGIYPVCTMIHISVLGNMKHVAMKFLRDIIQGVVPVGFHEVLFRLLKETSKDSKTLETVYSMLVGCYLEEGMMDIALKLMDFMKLFGTYPATGVLVTLVKSLLKVNNLELALSIFSEALYCGRNLTKHVLSLLMHYSCVQGNIAYACKLLSEMKNPDVVSYTIIIHALSKVGLLKESTIFVYKLIQRGISSDPCLISSVIDGYCKAGKFEEAVNIMKFFDFPPDVFIYNSFISGLCNAGNVMSATQLLFEMPENGIFPDFCNWTAIIAGYCKSNQIGNALKLLCGMLKRGLMPTVATYTALIGRYCKLGDLQEAKHMLNTMKNDGVRPDIVTYNLLIHGHGKKGMVHKAVEFLSTMKADGISPDVVTYNILIFVLVNGGFLNEAKGVLSELVSRGYSPDKFTYTNWMNGLFDHGNFQEAFHIWCHMAKTGIKPDVVCCTILIEGFCKAKFMPEACALFHKMLEAGLTPDVRLYNTLIHGFCRGGDVEEACRFINKMVETNVIPNGFTYSALVRGLQKNGVQNSEQVAAIKIQRILVENKIFVDSLAI